MSQQSLSSFIWSVADLLRGDYKQSDYGKVILPFTVLRRLDCVLEGTKDAVLAEYAAKKQAGVNPEPFLLRKAGQTFYNTSPMDMRKLVGDMIAAPFVIRRADVLMPVRNRLVFTESNLKWQSIAGTRDWKAYPPTVKEVRAWRRSMTRRADRGIVVSWTGAGWVRIHHMGEAEKRFKAMGLL